MFAESAAAYLGTPASLQSLVVCQVALGDAQGAVETYSVLLAVPGLDPLCLVESNLGLAHLHISLGHPPEAIAALRRFGTDPGEWSS